MAKRSYRDSTIPPHATCVFTGVIFDVYQWEQELFDGTKATFEKIARPDTVVVYPVLEDGRIMLIEDEQPGRAAQLGTPAGRVEDGELPEDAARRELKEETGLACSNLTLLNQVYPTQKLDWCVYIYVAKGCHSVGEPTPDAGERIKPHPVTFDEMLSIPFDAHTLDGSLFRLMAAEAKLHPEKMQEFKKLFT